MTPGSLAAPLLPNHVPSLNTETTCTSISKGGQILGIGLQHDGTVTFYVTHTEKRF